MYRIRRNIVILVILVMSIAAICLLLFWYHRWQPYEPVASGNFPDKPVWVFRADGSVVASPVVENGIAFVKTRHFLYGLDSATGRELWKADSESGPGIGLAPLVTSDLIIVPENYSGLAAFDVNSGKLIWRVPPLEISRTSSVSGSIQSMAANLGRLYVARFDWSLAAYDLGRGDILWEVHTPSRSFPALAANADRVFEAAGAHFSQYSASTGELLSEFHSDVYLPQIALDGQTLFESDAQNNLINAVDIAGKGDHLLWSAELPKDLDTFELNCLTANDDVVYVAADRLFALSKEDGHLLWTSENTGRLECPVFLGDEVYVRNTGNDLYAFNRETGAETGRLSVKQNSFLKHKPMRGPAVAGDVLLVPFGDNRIFAYRP